MDQRGRYLLPVAVLDTLADYQLRDAALDLIAVSESTAPTACPAPVAAATGFLERQGDSGEHVEYWADERRLCLRQGYSERSSAVTSSSRPRRRVKRLSRPRTRRWLGSDAVARRSVAAPGVSVRRAPVRRYSGGVSYSRAASTAATNSAADSRTPSQSSCSIAS